MISGMNLSKQNGKPDSEGHYANRRSRKQSEAIQEYMAKKDEPYNRTFSESPLRASMMRESDTNVIGRVERKKFRKQAQMQAGFASWLTGVFSASIVILVVGSYVKSTEVDWSEPANAVIVETNDAMIRKPASVEPTESESVEVESEPVESASTETDNETDSDDITLDGKPVSEMDLSDE